MLTLGSQNQAIHDYIVAADQVERSSRISDQIAVLVYGVKVKDCVARIQKTRTSIHKFRSDSVVLAHIHRYLPRRVLSTASLG